MSIPTCLRVLVLLLLTSATPRAAEPTGPTPDAAPRSEPMIHYHVRLPERQAHRVHVEMTLPAAGGEPLEIALPVWSPGSYLVREYARHVVELAAHDGAGRSLRAEKLDKNTWRLFPDGAEQVVVAYELYANERSVRTNEVNSDHAFLQPPATFFRHGPLEDRPHRVTVEAPDGWGVFTSLAARDGGWQAADYDELADSPLEIGPHEVVSFSVRDVPHRMVLAGDHDLDVDQLREDVTRLCEEVATVFDLMPFPDYTFLFLILDEGGGGLEHRNSSVCMTSRWGLARKGRYRRFLSLVAHEYFHAWNVKRFRPEALGPFDYDTENYTTDLWVAEGITSYLDDLMTLRAGFADSVDDYLGARANAWRTEAERFGARRMSLARSSLDAWIKLYRPDENSENTTVSYYSKGALVALQLDLRIRRLTGGERRLHDALRLGWERFTARGVGFPAGEVERLAAEVAGADLSDFFADTVHGTAPLEPNEDLAWVGLELIVEPGSTGQRDLPSDDDGNALEPTLGLTTRSRNGLVTVDRVTEDGPAFRAGLNHDDVLLALNDLKVTPDTLRDRLDRCGGDPIEVTFWRGQRLRRVTVEPRLEPVLAWSLKPVAEPSPEQARAFEDWTGWPHPKAPEPAPEPSEEEQAAAAQDASAQPVPATGDGD